MGAFHAYDIRGIYNVDFDRETAYKVGYFIPELLQTDKVLVGRKETYMKGDIVLALTSEGKYVMHRIIKVKDGTVILRGDANLRKTETCMPQDIAGAVISITRNGKHVLCSSAKEKAKSAVWQALFPFRRLILKIMRG